MDLSTKGAAWESPGQRPGSVSRRDATLPEEIIYYRLTPTQGFALGCLGPGLWLLNQNPLKNRRFMVFQDVRNNEVGGTLA